MRLPFDPLDTATRPTLRELADVLADVSDPSVVHELQKLDDRNNAAAIYERRIDAMVAGVGDDLGGYTVHYWGQGLKVYSCASCAYSHEREALVARHVEIRHGGSASPTLHTVDEEE